jgi:AmmeMemoRadiSam system protein B/AmmeMemoRadiSam system protein A
MKKETMRAWKSNYNCTITFFGKYRILHTLIIILYGVLLMSGTKTGLPEKEITRKAAVAGQFYPADPLILKKDVLSYMVGCENSPGSPRLLICPHAGYVFSGPVAGKAYSSIDKNIKKVIILGPSHYMYFEGIFITGADYYETPLGKVRIDSKIANKLRQSDLATNVEGADIQEHCIEVQLPFLQERLHDFSIMPILIGRADPERIAALLLPLIDSTTIVIASSDLSHYHTQKQTRSIDDHTVEAIVSGNRNSQIDACGELAIRTVMSLAVKLDLKAVTLDSRTSYETAPQYGSESRVVGYASILFVNKDKSRRDSGTTMKKEVSGEFDQQTRKFLLQLARQSLNASVRGDKIIYPDSIPSEVKENRGCFVTLTINGNLRGCIGYIEPIAPLYKAVIENARNAALTDPRFTAVVPDELGKIKVEISALTKPQPLHYSDPEDLLRKLRPGIDGVILQKGPYQSTFLPQVWEQLPDKVMFLEHLSLKGGMDRDGWRTANVKIYQAVHFAE